MMAQCFVTAAGGVSRHAYINISIGIIHFSAAANPPRGNRVAGALAVRRRRIAHLTQRKIGAEAPSKKIERRSTR